MYENHSQDSRFTGPLDTACTVAATYGTGGNNQPFVVEVQKAYGICAFASNSMKSNNPKSGIYEAETSRTLDLNGGNPACNQGGIAIVEPVATFKPKMWQCTDGDKASTMCATQYKDPPCVCLQGSMIGRQDQNGPQGDGINEEVAFTLNATDKHAVVYAIDRETFNCGQSFAKNLGINEDGVASTLNAQGPSAVASFYPQMKAESQCYREDGNANTLINGTNPGFQNGVLHNFIVRRLTPTECARLQGFPDWWAKDLETPNPTAEDVAFWREVFETHRKIVTQTEKPKTDKQIIKWLKDPHNDGAEYKMWGNGIALPSGIYAMQIISMILDAEGGNDIEER